VKIAVISDIHSNGAYLERFFQDCGKQGVKKFFCCGDLVGCYDAPNTVICLLRSKGVCCVKGNHDKYLLDELDYDVKKDHVYRVAVHREIISKENFDYLSNLPEDMSFKMDGSRFYMTHSLPEDTVSYCYDAPDIDVTLRKEMDFYLYGHTHIPLEATKYGVHFVNPGSVGQPRDYTRKGSYALIDTVSKSVKLRHFDVDVERYCQCLADKRFDAALISILKRTNERNK
jgi:putative phosphoesterase